MPTTREDFLVLKIFFEKNRERVGAASLYVEHDAERGLTAMQRATSSVVAAIAHMLASGEVAPGARLPEAAIGHHDVMKKLSEMDIEVVWDAGDTPNERPLSPA